MSEKTITSLWECECSSKNPLRFRQCKSCGRGMPNHFLSKIYFEELKEQKAFVLIEDFEASKKRCLKVGKLLEKMKSAVVPIMIVLVIVLNGGRFYLDGANISNLMFESVTRRQERLWNEVDNVQGTMSGLKSTPVIVETIFMDIVTRVKDVDKGIVDKQEEFEKHIDYKKIEQAKNKIEGVIKYVTSKFE